MYIVTLHKYHKSVKLGTILMKFTWMTPKRSSRSSITRSTYIKINPLVERDIKWIERERALH